MTKPFADRWAQRERELGLEEIASPMVIFGSDVLPMSAAPCVTFSAAAKPAPVFEVFASPEDWTADDKIRLAPFLVIGYDGAGNPICIEKNSGEVALLDHEDHFKTRQFVNTSVTQLAESLLAYMGEDSSARFKSALARIDSNALQEGTFWECEIKGLNDDA
ncbi:MAG: hypothetical protein EPO06_00890 [Burkholderiaceae bacterium]|nr:MAG: hypothetical protein EPO06_00890 [Burkholderiaceae bacterium]